MQYDQFIDVSCTIQSEMDDIIRVYYIRIYNVANTMTNVIRTIFVRYVLFRVEMNNMIMALIMTI